jgi:dTMP kinase
MFDGPDGVGKTTQLGLVRDELLSQGFDVYTSRFQGGTPLGDELSKVSVMPIERQPLTDHYIAMAIRTELVGEVAKRRQAGHVVLLDRSTLSSWAYQVFGSGLEADVVQDDLDSEMNRFQPNLIICYEASVPTLRTHMRHRNHKTDYFESKPDDYFERIQKGYAFAAERYGATIIDAEADIPTVHDRTMQVIRPLFKNQ